MSTPGEKAKLVNLLDTALANQVGLTSPVKIEVFFTISPKLKNLCGSIVVFRNNTFDAKEHNPFMADEAAAVMNKAVSTQTEVMARDPQHFREVDGQWIDWAMSRALELYDQYGGADIVVKCPKLKIKVHRNSGEVAAKRSNLDELFPVLKDIDQLLRGGFDFDPWSKTVRRGEINAKMSKR